MALNRDHASGRADDAQRPFDELADPARSRGARAPRPALAVIIALLVLLDVSYVLNAMDRQVFPVLVPAIRTDFGFSLGQAGLLASIFTLGVGLAGIPAGYLIDKYRRKNVILIGIAVFSVFTVLQAFAVSFGDMFVYRVLSGVGEGVQNAALFAALGAYYHRRRGLALGTLNFSYGLGGFIGPLAGAYLLTSTGTWQTPMWVYGGIGFLLLAIIAVAVPRGFTEVDTEQAAPGEHASIARLMNRNVIACAVAALIIGFCMYSYISLYPSFLKDELGFTTNQAGLAASMFGIGALVGIPAGWLGDRFNQRGVIIGALLGSMLIGGLLFNLHTGPGPQSALSFLEGAFASGFLYTNTYALIQRSAPAETVGRASGVFVTALYIPAAVSGYVFAALQGALGWGGAADIQLVALPVIGIIAMLALDYDKVRHPAVAAS